MQVNLYEIGDSGLGAGPFSDFVSLYILAPLRRLFTDIIPWPALILLVAALAWWLASWKLALTYVISMMFIGYLGMWGAAVDTFTQVLVAVTATIAIGVPLGIWAARRRTVERVMRPILDFLQTIPSFVYLVPVIMLFNVGRVPGLIASVLYALPPQIRLTTLGIRQVDERRGRSRRILRFDARPDAAQGAVPPGAAADHARRQPGDHDGAVDGDHCRHGRRGRAGSGSGRRDAEQPHGAERRGRSGHRHPGHHV
jgi:hypothetical protein